MAGPGIFNRTRIPLDADEAIPEATESTWSHSNVQEVPLEASTPAVQELGLKILGYVGFNTALLRSCMAAGPPPLHKVKPKHGRLVNQWRSWVHRNRSDVFAPWP
eukprot:symbB.v1.2.016670.t1/scaffold1269.1/size127624/2